MRRHIVLLFLLVAVFAAIFAHAQTDYGFPPEMAGEQLRLPPVMFLTTMIYTGAYNIPWSMPSIIGYEIDVAVGVQPEVFHLMNFATDQQLTMTWVEDCGCYADWIFINPVTIRFTAATCTSYPGGGWTATLWEGQLIYAPHPPQFWYFDPSYPMITAQINPDGIPPMEHGGIPYSADD